MMKKETVRLTQEQVEFLKNDVGISKGVRKAVEEYQKKNKYHIELYRSTTSGYAYFDILAKNLDEAMIETTHLRSTLTRNEILDKNFWYLKEIKQVA
jgi:hypothetical protein